jgi:hypothetical protein
MLLKNIKNKTFARNCTITVERKSVADGSYQFLFLIPMDQFIVDYSVEIPTRCSFVIEFIIPKFFKGSTCFERHTAHHQEL